MNYSAVAKGVVMDNFKHIIFCIKLLLGSTKKLRLIPIS